MASGLLEIGAVARELGVRPSTLRTWERRYRLVVPRRGSRGQRLYDAEQVNMLRRVLAQLGQGVRARAAHDLALEPRAVRTTSRVLRPSDAAPAEARRVVSGLLDDDCDPRFAFHLRLIASELVKNAVDYGSQREPIQLDARLFDEWAELDVENRGRMSMKRLRTRRREGGRGLEIVDALAEAWSIDTDAFGTRVTVRLAAVA
jgi:anti-sigma regulatory factor (Ser/Thr protein kinase)